MYPLISGFSFPQKRTGTLATQASPHASSTFGSEYGYIRILIRSPECGKKKNKQTKSTHVNPDFFESNDVANIVSSLLPNVLSFSRVNDTCGQASAI